jgi:hypothetical protein
MKPDFLGSMPFDEKFMKYLNTSAILADVEMYLKKFLEDPDVIDSLLSMDDISNNMDDELYEFIMFDTSDEVQSIIDILSLNLGTDYVMERELSDMHSDIKSLVVDYIRSLPEANRKTLQNAINTHKVMSERVPANVAAQIAAYRTGVAPRNNPAYMK